MHFRRIAESKGIWIICCGGAIGIVDRRCAALFTLIPWELTEVLHHNLGANMTVNVYKWVRIFEMLKRYYWSHGDKWLAVLLSLSISLKWLVILSVTMLNWLLLLFLLFHLLKLLLSLSFVHFSNYKNELSISR